jgi:hypothetical protein
MGNVDGEFNVGVAINQRCSFYIFHWEWFNSSSILKDWIFERFYVFMM